MFTVPFVLLNAVILFVNVTFDRVTIVSVLSVLIDNAALLFVNVASFMYKIVLPVEVTSKPP